MALRFENLTPLLLNYQAQLQDLTKYISNVWAMVEEAAAPEVVPYTTHVEVPLVLSHGQAIKTQKLPSTSHPSETEPVYGKAVYDYYTTRMALRVSDEIPLSESWVLMELDAKLKEMFVHFERQLFGDGSGVLAKLSAPLPTQAPWKYYVKPYYVGDTDAYRLDAIKYFFLNSKIAGFNQTNGSKVTNDAVVLKTGVDVTANEVKPYVIVDRKLDNAAENLVLCFSESGYNNDIPGLLAITKPGPFAGVDHPNWEPYTYGDDLEPNSLVLTRERLREIFAAFNVFSGGNFPLMLVTTERVIGKISTLTENWIIHQVAPGQAPIDFGFGAPAQLTWFNNRVVPIYVSQYCPEGTMFIINKGALKIYYPTGGKFHWITDKNSGALWHYTGVAGTTDYECYGKTTFALISPDRRQFLRVSNIKVD